MWKKSSDPNFLLEIIILDECVLHASTIENTQNTYILGWEKTRKVQEHETRKKNLSGVLDPSLLKKIVRIDDWLQMLNSYVRSEAEILSHNLFFQ